jgi:CheY-like chemotaxis protein
LLYDLEVRLPATILICDDEEPLRRLVRSALDGRGHEIVESRDGDEALDLARATRPDLVILDLKMPGRTGLEVLTELRSDPRLADTRVLVLTASAHPPNREAVLAAGADRFLAKPFSPLELVSIVDGLLRARS